MYTQADLALMREMHIDMGEPYEPVTVAHTLAQLDEALASDRTGPEPLTIVEVSYADCVRLSQASEQFAKTTAYAQLKYQQDAAKCAAIRESTRVREDQRSGARALSAAIWIGAAVLFLAWLAWMVWRG